MRSILIGIGIVLATNAAVAAPQVEAIASLVKTDADVYRVLVLIPGEKPLQDFCGPEWDYGYLQYDSVSPSDGRRVDTPGCWLSSAIDPDVAQIDFRYMSLPPGRISSFRVPAKVFTKVMLDTETGDLY